MAVRREGGSGGGEILVSGTVKDLVMGSDFRFEDRGETSLKGLPGQWQVYAVKGLNSAK